MRSFGIASEGVLPVVVVMYSDCLGRCRLRQGAHWLEGLCSPGAQEGEDTSSHRERNRETHTVVMKEVIVLGFCVLCWMSGAHLHIPEVSRAIVREGRVTCS